MSRLILAANAGPLTGRGNNTWFLDGEVPALIDAGIGTPAHVNEIAAGLGNRPLGRVLVTHCHPDHASGLPALRARWPSLEAWKWPVAGESGWHAAADGQRLRAGDRDLTVIHTPGHASDHVCFFDEPSGDLYAGDMVVQGTTIMIPAGRGGDLRAYLASLERLAALRPARILPGHGPIIDRPLELIGQYLEHRRQREKQVLACLADGVTDVDAMVMRIYPDLHEALRPSARLTVEAHLEKLRLEGRLP